MKTTGIVLIAIGSLSTLGWIIAGVKGKGFNFVGVGLIILGAYLINRANKKTDEESEKNQWKEELD